MQAAGNSNTKSWKCQYSQHGQDKAQHRRHNRPKLGGW